MSPLEAVCFDLDSTLCMAEQTDREIHEAVFERVDVDPSFTIADAFDATVFCDPADGLEPKPDPAPFERALADLDAAPESTVYVGDSHGADVVGARAAGLRSVWVPPGRPHEEYPDDPEPAPTHRLESLADLPEIL